MKNKKNFLLLMFACCIGLQVDLAQAQLEAVADADLSEAVGQSLFVADYIAPGTGGNPNGDIGYFRMGLDAKLEFNANIRKLQLGCGGVKGAGVCDVDMDNVRFTGVASTAYNADGNSNEGVNTDAVLTKPFIEIALKNPGSSGQREIVGIRLGAAGIFGALSMGERPTSVANDPAQHSGLNRISGDFTAFMGGNIPISQCIFGANASHTACNIGGGLNMGNAVVDPSRPKNQKALVLNRASSTYLERMEAEAIGFIKLDSNLDEPLSFLHNMTLAQDSDGNGSYDAPISDFSLSLQKQNLAWSRTSGSWSTAQRGWWMSVPRVDITNWTSRRVYVGLDEIVGGLFAGAPIELSNLDILQRGVDNCRGGRSFC